jgi:hypothetical protein
LRILFFQIRSRLDGSERGAVPRRIVKRRAGLRCATSLSRQYPRRG